jgi:signal transduction histidine kinase/CheY-like chemotaxis protein
VTDIDPGQQPEKPGHLPNAREDTQVFLGGNGEMATLMRARDWSATPVGPARDWPQPLRTVIRLVLNTRHPMFVFWGPTLACFYNDAYSSSIGPERHPCALGRPGREVWSEIWETIGPQIELVMSGGGATWHENQLVPITRHGRRDDVYWTYSYSPIDDEAAPTGVGGVLVVCTETTAHVLAQRREAERAAVRTAERDRLAQMFERAPSFMALLAGPEHRFEFANQAYLRVIGHRDVLGKTVAEALPDAVAQGYLAILDDVFRSGKPFSTVGAKFVVQPTPGGPLDERFVDFIFQPMTDEFGEVTGIFVEGADVTNRARAQAALRDLNDTLEQRVAAEISARVKTEEALLQAQKMEAVGQLTGGIAHDFNNMLQGVTSGINLARRRLAAGDPDEAIRFLDLAVEATGRTAALTRRLLAFGRRQALDPRPVRLDDLIRGLEGLLQRTVGPEVQVELRMRGDCWPVRSDPNQVESALINLAINARDAMPLGSGRLLIETTHVALDKAAIADWEVAAAGDYVCISVTDNGTGMAADVLAHAFEPFFTTKPSGQGTGLGLSQLYGFVRQSRGIVRLESEVGVGTSVHVYLPRHDEAPPVETDAPSTEKPRRGPYGEVVAATVLLVEDDGIVRDFAARALREMGYRVIEAEDGLVGLNELRNALSEPATIGVDILVTDVGLPGGLNGRQLADAARELVPALPILLTTGYAGCAIEGSGQLAPRMEMLAKPFELTVLADRIEAMIKRADAAASF